MLFIHMYVGVGVCDQVLHHMYEGSKVVTLLRMVVVVCALWILMSLCLCMYVCGGGAW